MTKFYIPLTIAMLLLSCTQSGNEDSNAIPPYGREVLSRDESNVNTVKIEYYVSTDTVARYGASEVLLALTKQDCAIPCAANLWDSKEAEQLNRANPYGQRTDEWQREHYVSIADHLVAFKDFGSDEVIRHPLTYDSNYKRWGGKLKH